MKIQKDLLENLNSLQNMKEDFPGQLAECRRQLLIEAAVHAGDEILLDYTDGSVEELEYLTAAVASRWAQKAFQASQSRLMRYDLEKQRSKSGQEESGKEDR